MTERTELLELAIEAHGGLTRWREVASITATVSAGGVFWASRGQAGAFNDPVTVTVEAHAQRCSITGLTGRDRRAVFTPDRVAIETTGGELVQERRNPRASFVPGSAAPWDALHLAYFAGYAQRTYLTVPFLLAEPGFLTEEIDPAEEDGEVRRRLRARFPSHIASHCSEQVFHFGPDGLLRRHDYTSEVFAGDLGHLSVAHYVSDHVRSGGISFPTRRRAVRLQPDGTTIPQPVFVTIHLGEIAVE